MGAVRARALLIGALLSAQALATITRWPESTWALAALGSAVLLVWGLPGRGDPEGVGPARLRHAGFLQVGLSLGDPREGLAVAARATAWAVPVVLIMIAGAVIAVRLAGTTQAELDALPRDFYSLDHLGTFLWRGVVVAPLAEEIVWRGLVQRQLDRALGPWPAIALSGFLFWTMHWVSFGYVTPINHLLGGWVIAWSWHRTNGGLVAPILLHAIGNLAIAGGTALWILRPGWLRSLLGIE